MAKQNRHQRRPRSISNNTMLTLFRYYRRASRMYELATDAVRRAHEKFGPDWSRHVATDEIFDVWLFFDYWLAGLRAIVEGYQNLHLKWPAVEALLKSNHLPMLNDYRHGIAHFHETFFDPQKFRLAMEDEGIRWARSLFEELGAGIRAEVKVRSDALTAAGITRHPSWAEIESSE